MIRRVATASVSHFAMQIGVGERVLTPAIFTATVWAKTPWETEVQRIDKPLLVYEARFTPRFPIPTDTALLLPWDYAEHVIGPQFRQARARMIHNIVGDFPTRH